MCEKLSRAAQELSSTNEARASATPHLRPAGSSGSAPLTAQHGLYFVLVKRGQVVDGEDGLKTGAEGRHLAGGEAERGGGGGGVTRSEHRGALACRKWEGRGHPKLKPLA